MPASLQALRGIAVKTFSTPAGSGSRRVADGIDVGDEVVLSGDRPSVLVSTIQEMQLCFWGRLHCASGERFFQIPREDRSKTFVVRRNHSKMIAGNSLNYEL